MDWPVHLVAIFHVFMNKVLRDTVYKWSIVYFDYILINSQSFDECVHQARAHIISKRHLPAGLLEPLPVQHPPWSQIDVGLGSWFGGKGLGAYGLNHSPDTVRPLRF